MKRFAIPFLFEIVYNKFTEIVKEALLGAN